MEAGDQSGGSEAARACAWSRRSEVVVIGVGGGGLDEFAFLKGLGPQVASKEPQDPCGRLPSRVAALPVMLRLNLACSRTHHVRSQMYDVVSHEPRACAQIPSEC